MKEKPILFSTPMVKAILDGKKTMTRRVIKPQPPEIWDRARHLTNDQWVFENSSDNDFHGFKKCPYGQVGDRLWVKEKFRRDKDFPSRIGYEDGLSKMIHGGETGYLMKVGWDVNWGKCSCL